MKKRELSKSEIAEKVKKGKTDEQRGGGSVGLHATPKSTGQGGLSPAAFTCGLKASKDSMDSMDSSHSSHKNTPPAPPP